MADGATSLGDGKCLRETNGAILVELESGEEKWIPKLCLHDNSEVWKDGQTGDIIVKSWWAEKEGLG